MVSELWGRGQLGREGGGAAPSARPGSPYTLPTLHFCAPQWAWCPFAAEGRPELRKAVGDGERRDRWLRGRGMVREGW